MRKKTLFSAFLFFTFLLFGCTNQDKSGSNSIAATKKINEDTLSEEREFKGLFFPAQEGSGGTLTICAHPDSSVFYAVIDKSDSLTSFYKKILPNAYPFQTIFIDILAEQKKSKAHSNPQTIVLKKIIRAEQKYFQNDCIPYNYWCIGNEPFWQVQISEKENLIDFYDPMIQKFYHFEYVKSENKNDEIIYSTTNKTDKIRIVIKKQKCSDGMSEREYSYKTKVIFNNKTFEGCAIAFGETSDSNR